MLVYFAGAGVDSSPERTKSGFLGEPVQILVEMLEPLRGITKFDDCDTQLVVKSGIRNDAAGINLEKDIRGQHPSAVVALGINRWLETIDDVCTSRATWNVVHQIFRIYHQGSWRFGGSGELAQA